MKTHRTPVALSWVFVGAAEGVKLTPVAALLIVLCRPTQLLIGNRLDPLTRFAGRVKVSEMFALFSPVTW